MRKQFKRHSDLDVFNGSLFGYFKESVLNEDIGKKVAFKSPTCPAENGKFVIRELQKNWKGDIIYRVYQRGDNVGRPASPKEVYFV